MLAVLTVMALSVVRVPYAIVIGLPASLGTLLSYTDGPASLTATEVVCFANSDLTKMAVGLVTMAAVMFVDGTCYLEV